MRYDGPVLTEIETRRLIDEVDCWCRRTGTNYNKLVVVAGVGVTTRHKVRVKGRRVTLRIADRLRTTMQAHPDGISRDHYRAVPKPWDALASALNADERPLQQHVTCARCGAREGKCEHVSPNNEVVSHAA